MNLTRKLNQTAVFWNPELARDTFGRDVFEAGLEIAVRWQDVVEEFINTLGERDLSAAVVYLESPANVFRVDSRLYLGTAASLTAGQLLDPTTVANAFAVRAIAQSPSRTAGQTLFKAWLKR